jgi:galacturan 1,4-alpha-galacturonidase
MKYSVLCLAAITPCLTAYVVNTGTDCSLFPESSTHNRQPVDDSASIVEAFDLCGVNGTVTFTAGSTFYVNKVLNTTNLLNCKVFVKGDVFWSTNVPYWLSHSINVGLQNQSTAWLFGGTNVSIDGTGGSFNGNGQTWYDENQNHANQPGRPISITFFNSTNLLVENLRFIQPQFWATFISYSSNITMRNIFVNATSNSKWGTDNTDGSDTWNSRDILMENWFVQNGDDCIAAKGNTTNLTVRNVTCIGGTGMTIGSVGQYLNNPDYVENVLFEDITCVDSIDGAYVKTWQGVEQSQTGNGDSGGGGSGLINNITFRNFRVQNVDLPIQITQCIYSEHAGASTCDTSRMQISNITWQNFTGTSKYNVAASLHCAASHPCPDIYFRDVNITSVNATKGLKLFNTTVQDEVFQCANIVNQNTSSGIGCNRWAPNNFPQYVGANVQ